MWLLALLLASCTLTTAATANKCGFPPPHAVASLQNGDALALRADWVAPCGRLTANKHRLLHATANGAALLDARQLLTPRRFDLGAKLAYARARLAGRRGKYALTLYGASVRALNGFAEHDPPQRAKGSLLEFALAFDSVLGIAEAGWLNATAFVPVSADDAAAPAGGEGGEEGFVGVSIVDGAHRTAAAAALGRPLPVLRLARGHAASFDFRWFRQRGLSERYAQASAVEWLRWRPQARLLLLWPAGDSAHLPGSGGGAKDARKWMSHAKALAEVATHGAIYYEGTVEVDAAADGPLLLMATLYRGEEWLGDAAGGWAGAANKRHSCFPRPQGRAGEISTPMQSVRVVVFEGDALKAKLAVRALYEKEGAVSDSHSVAHSTDTAAETAEVATLLLSESGRQFVNRVQLAGLGGGGMWDRAATQLTDTLKVIMLICCCMCCCSASAHAAACATAVLQLRSSCC